VASDVGLVVEGTQGVVVAAAPAIGTARAVAAAENRTKRVGLAKANLEDES
jgi:hypothetical protein